MDGEDYVDITPKAGSMEEITDKLDFIKIKTPASWKTMSRMWEDKLQTGENNCKRHTI